MRQFGLGYDLGLARIADIDRGEILGSGLVRKPQYAPAIRCKLHVDALPDAAETIELVLRQQFEIQNLGFGRIGRGLGWICHFGTHGVVEKNIFYILNRRLRKLTSYSPDSRALNMSMPTILAVEVRRRGTV